MSRSYDDIKNAVLKKGHIFFESGSYNLNLIWERTSDIITNKFDDFLHIAYLENGENKILTLPCTTKPGINDITTSFIICGQYRGVWKYNEGIKNKQYPFNVTFFEQIKGVDYYLVKNNIVDRNKIINDYDANTHLHRMSEHNISGRNVNNWSWGCMGAENPYFCQLIELAQKSINLYGILFTGTIMETKDFE